MEYMTKIGIREAAYESAAADVSIQQASIAAGLQKEARYEESVRIAELAARFEPEIRNGDCGQGLVQAFRGCLSAGINPVEMMLFRHDAAKSFNDNDSRVVTLCLLGMEIEDWLLAKYSGFHMLRAEMEQEAKRAAMIAERLLDLCGNLFPAGVTVEVVKSAYLRIQLLSQYWAKFFDVEHDSNYELNRDIKEPSNNKMFREPYIWAGLSVPVSGSLFNWLRDARRYDASEAAKQHLANQKNGIEWIGRINDGSGWVRFYQDDSGTVTVVHKPCVYDRTVENVAKAITISQYSDKFRQVDGLELDMLNPVQTLALCSLLEDSPESVKKLVTKVAALLWGDTEVYADRDPQVAESMKDATCVDLSVARHLETDDEDLSDVATETHVLVGEWSIRAARDPYEMLGDDRPFGYTETVRALADLTQLAMSVSN
jgi:hypothetical protein